MKVSCVELHHKDLSKEKNMAGNMFGFKVGVRVDISTAELTSPKEIRPSIFLVGGELQTSAYSRF
ncbi:hypothetical protein [Microbulbifer sp. JTAC008]|uniref:hypothetical protein n=1 Tax=unclassified Microbulbifer TaxID=2619833 RepID=UPI0040392025